MMTILRIVFILIFAKVIAAYIESTKDCGIVDNTEGLIIGGVKVIKNEFPWSVAIFHKTDGNQFICGGTLITRRKVITAAHCILPKYSDEVKNAKDIELRLGAYDLRKNNEIGLLKITPSNITIHPDYKPFVTNYDADIAVIDLPFEVKTSKYVRPICIWERRHGPPEFAEGQVVGWGVAKHNSLAHENVARKLKIPVIKNEKCFLEEPLFTQLSSNRTFCGGARTGQGPCRGDSGAGLYFINKGKFYLGGMVSAATFDTFNNCDVKNFALYTDFYKFIPWLDGRKFNEKSMHQQVCDRYKNKRPKRPTDLPFTELPTNEAEVGEFPHMALIGYENLFPHETNDLHFGCNGVLISETFVASTVHCLSFHHSSRKPIVVRLGAIKKTSKLNGVSIARDIPIKNVIIHDNHSHQTFRNDISLIELEKPAPLSYFVWPACLYSDMDDSRRLWIATSPWSSVSRHVPEENFQKFPVEEITVEECKKIYVPLGIEVSKKTLCAKYVINTIYTFYYGRGGTPIQTLEGDAFYVGGINFFGIVSKDNFTLEQPDAFTRMAAYIDWIEERAWPDSESLSKPLNFQKHEIKKVFKAPGHPGGIIFRDTD